MKIFTLVLILAASIAGQTIPEQIAKLDKPKHYTVEYDKFKDITFVSNAPVTIPETPKGKTFLSGLAVEVSFNFTGQTMDVEPAKLWLTFRSNTSDWVYLRSHHLIIIADGQRYDFGEGVRSSDIFGRSVAEVLSYRVTRDELKAIVDAQSVDVQLGPTETVLNAKTLAVLKNVLTLATKPQPH